MSSVQDKTEQDAVFRRTLLLVLRAEQESHGIQGFGPESELAMAVMLIPSLGSVSAGLVSSHHL